MGKRPGNRGDYAERWNHIKYNVLIHSTADHIVFIDLDGDLDWETTIEYDDSVARRPGYDLAAVNSILNEGTILEVNAKQSLSNPERSQLNRLIGEAIACALEIDYAGARRMIAAAQEYVYDRKRAQLTKEDSRKTTKPSWEVPAIFAFGVVFVSLLIILAMIFREPSAFQYFIFRTIIALAAAAIAALIPGLLHVQIPAVRAGGALAVFALVFLFSPASLVSQAPASSADAAGPPAVERPVTDLGNRISAFSGASAANKAQVRTWLDVNASGMPLAIFIRSGRADLYQRMIQDLLIP
jgi:hypothetical protein